MLVTEPFITFSFFNLPPKPWPITVADVPVFIRQVKDPIDPAEVCSEPMDMGRIGRNGKLKMSPIPTIGETPTNEVIRDLRDAVERYEVKIGCISWFGSCFILDVKSPLDFNADTLPGLVGQNVLYYKSSPSKPSLEAALRQKLPSGEEDDSDYGKTLRPGVLLNNIGHEGSSDLSTTAGLPVKSKDGRKYVTVSAQGFPGLNSPVYHPNKNGSRVGTMVAKIGGTDVGLARLYSETCFSNINFSSDQEDGPTLTEFKPIKEVRRRDLVFMDTPYSGRCDGVIIGRTFESNPPGSGNEEEEWIVHECIYTGNGRPGMIAGTCGTVLWDSDDKAVAFFQSVHPSTGMCWAVSTQCLQDLGFTIEAIS
ncbi:MAG: hypothetical protein M1837_004748 [Sclerophora amabilis]|nr:MAG: hypothetical protein M1837_004748 [Sclerophora amabilis]